MNTAPVARDIVEIFERHGEWRDVEAKRILAEAPPRDQSAVLTRTAYTPGAEMVQYWGFVSIDTKRPATVSHTTDS